MKLIHRLLTAATVATLLVLTSCETPPKPPVESDAPFADLYAQAADLKSRGVLVALGTGIDANGRFDIALDKATIDAQAKVSQAMESKVQSLTKSFTESLSGSTSEGTELNEAFSKTITVASKQTLSGVTTLSKPKQLKDGKKITVAVLMGIDPKTLNSSLINQVQTADPKLYERFRASKAYDELKSEMDGYDGK